VGARKIGENENAHVVVMAVQFCTAGTLSVVEKSIILGNKTVELIIGSVYLEVP
jgi:hypothetical protein